MTKKFKLKAALLSIGLVTTLVSPVQGAEFDTKKPRTPKLNSTNIAQNEAIDSQLKVLSQQGAIDNDLKGISGQVNVIVHYDEPSVGLERGLKQTKSKKWSKLSDEKVKEKIAKQQQKANSKMQNKGIKYKKNHSYQTVINAEAMTVDAKDIEKIAQIEDVALVEKDDVIQIDPSEMQASKQQDVAKDTMGDELNLKLIPSITHLKVDKVWELGNKGKGVKVGVIDTGIDYNHPDLKDVYKGGRNYVGGGDYNTKRNADDPYETKPEERPGHLPEVNESGSEYYTTHGTHVAGTIAAQGKNEFGMYGIAPNVDLYAYRVLGAYGRGSTSWIVGGIEDAVKDDMDVINLSLGNSSPEENQANSMAVNNAMLLGVTANVATGNSGPERSTIGGPATSPLGIGVGNTTLPEERIDVDLKLGEETKNYKLMAYEFGNNPETTLKDQYELVNIPGLGKKEDFAQVNVKDKVALVERGEIAFVEKIKNAKDAGAKAVIVYNSETGSNSPGPADIFVGASFDYIPTVDMDRTQGLALKAKLEKEKVMIDFTKFNVTTTPGDDVNDSSSRGPSLPNFDIKPDVSAPGTNILSTIPSFAVGDNYSKAYAQYTGTSMATPHISGVSALLKELHPEWTPFDIKSALSNTAKHLDKSKFDVFSQGAGLVQPLEAATATSLFKVAHETEVNGVKQTHTRGTIAFGNQVPTSKAQVITKTIDVQKLSSDDNYAIEVETTRPSKSGATVTTDVQSIQSGKVTVNLNIPAGTPVQGDEIQGYIHFKGNRSYALPFAANLSEVKKKGFEKFALTNYHMSPNGDGNNDASSVHMKVYNKQNLTLLKYYDLLNEKSGPAGDGYVGSIDLFSGLDGEKEVVLDGKLYNIEGSNRVEGKLADGVYAVDAITTSDNGNATADDYPLFVKTKPAEIKSLALNNGKLSFKLDDLYINAKETLASYDINYNVSEFLKASYELSNNKTGEVVISDGGEGTIDINDKGEYHLTLNVEDVAGNKASFKYTVNTNTNEVSEGHKDIKDNTGTPVDEAKTLTDSEVNQFVNGKQKVLTVEGDKAVTFTKSQLAKLSQMKKNKSIVLNTSLHAVSLNSANMNELSKYGDVTIQIKKVDSTYQNAVQVLVKAGDSEVKSLVRPYALYIKGNRGLNVYNADANQRVASKYDKKLGQYGIQVTQFNTFGLK
ncbi:S8 family serine peptidase [Macrococcus sp. S115]|uniref:S8 family serine peptidase n=1 Tax=Macrococcus sp. S115 TaxID=3047480 RepID=UPI0024BD36B9|nr:S8 family serine peptidase [Macrococcus sp. S115]MDJ1112357.1 S8 family serine peptidase [Macrococcus sp. S115]